MFKLKSIFGEKAELDDRFSYTGQVAWRNVVTDDGVLGGVRDDGAIEKDGHIQEESLTNAEMKELGWDYPG